jgi:hypothetical protein
MVDRQPAATVLPVAKLAGTGSELVAELSLLRRLVGIRLVMMDSQGF